jgi:hypothetical protein
MLSMDLTDQSIQTRFEAFHANHPEVYRAIVKLAFDLKTRGFRRYGLKSLFERVRWHFQIDLDLGEEWKLNNNYTSRYARKLMAEFPELEGFFEVRELKAA